MPPPDAAAAAAAAPTAVLVIAMTRATVAGAVEVRRKPAVSPIHRGTACHTPDRDT